MPSRPTSQQATTPSPLDRRERKRKHDRDAQRVSRERQKNRVKELEETIRSLQAANENPEQISGLLAQVQTVRDENAKLRDKMRKAAECLGQDADVKQNAPPVENSGHVDDMMTTDHACSMSSVENRGINLDYADIRPIDDEPMFVIPTMPASVHSYDYQIADSEINNSILDDQLVSINTSSPALRFNGNDESPNNDAVANIAAMILGNPHLEGRFWHLAGVILDHILALPEGLTTPRALDDDITIRACVEGWHIVEKMYWLDAGWRWLRKLDEHLYIHLSITSRMAMIRIMRIQYLIQRQPARATELSVPGFLIPRPAQKKIKHEHVVEHFVWPGMREHLLFSRTRYATNRFMEPFCKSIRFAWPHDPQDAYELQPATELYSFTSSYLHRQSEIGCWQIDCDFFELFPELRAEMPATGISPPRTLSELIDFDSNELQTVDSYAPSDTSADVLQHAILPVANSATAF